MTWEEACEDSSLNDLPFKIELNGEGNLVMSQIWLAHGGDQAEIGFQLAELLPHGRASMETGVMTSDNVKAVDVVWLTREHFIEVKDAAYCTSAPAICVEVACGGDPTRSFERKKPLYFEAGAKEVWFCDRDGQMAFHTPEGQAVASPMCPDFPANVRRDFGSPQRGDPIIEPTTPPPR